MSGPIYSNFEIVRGNPFDCLEEVQDDKPQQKECTVQVSEVRSGLKFQLVKKGNLFEVAAQDVKQVTRALPGFKVPYPQIYDYLLIRSKFYEVFGDRDHPTSVTKNFNLAFTGNNADPKDLLHKWINNLAVFLSHQNGRGINQDIPNLRKQSIAFMMYLYADPAIGNLADQKFDELKKSKFLSPIAHTNMKLLLSVNEVRKRYWELTQTHRRQGNDLDFYLQGTGYRLISFLFSEGAPKKSDYDPLLTSNFAQDSKQAFHNLLSKVDKTFIVSKNYFAYMAEITRALKETALNPELRAHFQIRANLLTKVYEKMGQEETRNFLTHQPFDVSFKESLLIEYGSDPERVLVLKIILNNLRLKIDREGKPEYHFDMNQMDRELRSWIESLSEAEKGPALGAISFLLKELFERNGTMQVFWNGEYRELNNFYQSFSMLTQEKLVLEDMIRWVRGMIREGDYDVGRGVLPHVGLRKWTLGAESGIGLLSLGAAVYLQNQEETSNVYYSRGAAVILGAAGLGAAAGNLLAYALDVDKGSWAFDVGGAILGGLLGGLIFGATTDNPNAPPSVGPDGYTLPENNSMGNNSGSDGNYSSPSTYSTSSTTTTSSPDETRNPVDEFGF